MKMHKQFYLTATAMLCLSVACTRIPQQPRAIELSDMDTTVAPGVDFDAYANSGWKKKNPLPADKGRFGTFDKLDDQAMDQVNTLFEEISNGQYPEGSIERKIAAFYASGMDTAALESAGLTPLKPYLDQAEAIKNTAELQKTVAQWHRMGINPLFYIYADADQKNSLQVIAYLNQGGLGMPDRDYYLNEDARSKGIQEKYIGFAEGIFRLMGDPESVAKENAQMVYAFEKKLATASMSLLDQRDPYKTYHKMTLKDLSGTAPSIDWDAYFRETGINDPGELIVSQPEFFAAVSTMMKTEPLESWKTYLKWQLVSRMSSYLSRSYAELSFGFYGRTLSGQQAQRPRWKRVQDVTDGALSEAVGQMYVKKYFPPEAKQRMIDLVENLRTSLGERIHSLEWMSETTKQKAREKLNRIAVKVGYPDKWRDYSALEVTSSGYVANILNSGRFDFDWMMQKINKPVDRSEWLMPPQMVNAYYNPTGNEIVFPAAILQPPFFYMNGDDAVNYGAIGVVIGHEMTHGFDDQGRQYDLNGNLNDWWTEEDAGRFNERASVLAAQYDQFTVLDSMKANGKLTLGENIADLGGLNIAFQAFQNVKTGKEEPIDGLTPEQRFFLSYAHIWAQNIRDEEIVRRTKTDVHSLGKYRVNGPLPNMPEFHQAFGIREGEAMYLPADRRAMIW